MTVMRNGTITGLAAQCCGTAVVVPLEGRSRDIPGTDNALMIEYDPLKIAEAGDSEGGEGAG